MNITNNPFFGLLLAITVFITMQACAGMGGMRGDDVRIYYESIDKMVEISRDAIHNKGYSVTNIQQRRESSRRTTITFVNRSTAGQQMVSSMQTYVHLAKVDTADAVAIRVDNPDYNYGTPTDQRIDYAKLLFAEIDKLLE
ncbi:hypothetical protein NC796_19510 [Aliifodinibius sp. S!AR15-10]|uniref:hypothetical protein n=1 Tax=Aliifodinibius sp. S!AR15-10 TaxID=2950437 RepID=UPI002865E295|nr:hypothetical protein [Aliifodinibius sp. S!AR15-10]MDR8393351.1 hypothetical protein [Aliifodinibius sp. S!AR15-10]